MKVVIVIIFFNFSINTSCGATIELCCGAAVDLRRRLLRRAAIGDEAPQLERFYTVPKFCSTLIAICRVFEATFSRLWEHFYFSKFLRAQFLKLVFTKLFLFFIHSNLNVENFRNQTTLVTGSFLWSALFWNCFLCWDRRNGDVMATLDAALLCSSRAGSNPDWFKEFIMRLSQFTLLQSFTNHSVSHQFVRLLPSNIYLWHPLR